MAIKSEIRWQSGGDSRPQYSIQDYDANLKHSVNFVHRVSTHLIAGMKVYLTGSSELPRSLLMICWIPGRYERIGNYANPVSLLQKHSSFTVETEATYMRYRNIAKQWLDQSDRDVGLKN
jgi:hypothetical protein